MLISQCLLLIIIFYHAFNYFALCQINQFLGIISRQIIDFGMDEENTLTDSLWCLIADFVEHQTGYVRIACPIPATRL